MSATKTIANNAESLNKSLLEVYNGLNEGSVSKSLAKELANTAGKIIKLNISRIEYKRTSESDDKIDFFEE